MFCFRLQTYIKFLGIHANRYENLATVDTGRKYIEVESVKEKHAKHDADCDFFSSFASETGKYRKAGFERAAKQRL